MAKKYDTVLFLFYIASILYLIKPSHLKIVHIAAVLPLEHGTGDYSSTFSWERGLEILPGAQIAIESINQCRNFLPKDTLELIVIDSKNCRDKVNQDFLLNLLDITFYQDVDIIGFIGAHCLNSYQNLSPFFASAFVNQPFLSSSVLVSDQGSNSTHYYGMLQPADIFIDAISCLANDLDWCRIAVVTDTTYKYLFTFAEAVYNVMAEGKSHKVAPFIQLHEDLNIKAALQELKLYDSKVILLSLSIAGTIGILCEAKQRKWIWPEYAWIVHSIAPTDFSLAAQHVSTNVCNVTAALEGVVFFKHRLSSMGQFINLPMEHTSDDFIKKYVEKLAKSSKELNITLTSNEYANLLHDSVWVLSLAQSSILFPDNIRNVSFMGASGRIEFNDTQNIGNGVDIFRVRNGSFKHEGYYNAVQKQITFLGSMLQNPRPIEKCRVENDNTSLVYTSFFSLIFVLCAIGTTAVLFLYIYYRKEPEIKATSVTLSLLMFLGCYIILFYMLMAIMYTQSLVPTTSSFNICLALLWPGLTGFSLPLILATLLVKMLRITRIFTHFGSVGKSYSDVALLLYVLILISPNIIILTVWSVADPYSSEVIITEHLTYTEVEQRCYSKQLLLWFCILYLNIEGLAIVIVIVALKTRKIRRENFKDTKKVNAFIFILLIVIYVINVQWLILRAINIKKGYSSIPLHVSHVIIVVSCQGLLFFPKVLPPLQRNLWQRHCLTK